MDLPNVHQDNQKLMQKFVAQKVKIVGTLDLKTTPSTWKELK